MIQMSRRWLLGLPVLGAAAAGFAHHLQPPPHRSTIEVDARHLVAQESPIYDTSFAAFASRLSLGAGDELMIRACAPFKVDAAILRVAWSDSATVGRRVHTSTDIDVHGGDPAADPLEWPVALRCPVTRDWESGLYAAVLVDRDEPSRRRFAPFVVRAPIGDARIVVTVPFTTYHAYNAWGGASLYSYNSPAGTAAVLPIGRPFDVFDGAGFMFYGDWQLARWLDRERYTVSYITSYDLHRDPRVLDGAAVVVTAFHDEYWSTPMRQRLEEFIAAGGNAVFLAANSIYWRIRLDDTTMTCHKGSSVADDPDPDVTALWRSPLIGEPEHLILGSQYQGYDFPYGKGYDWTVAADDHWMYRGTGLSNGMTLPGLVGYEWDNAPRPIPDGVTVLARTEFVDSDGDAARHEATERIHPDGGTVVNVGTTYWPRFLLGGGAFRADTAVQQMTHNLLRRLGRS